MVKDPLWVFLWCFSVAAVAGLAQLLHSGQPLTVRSVLSATLHSGMSGMIVGLLWFNFFTTENIYFLVGLSGLAGIAGSSAIEFLCQLVAGNIGLSIKIDKGNEHEGDKKGGDPP